MSETRYEFLFFFHRRSIQPELQFIEIHWNCHTKVVSNETFKWATAIANEMRYLAEQRRHQRHHLSVIWHLYMSILCQFQYSSRTFNGLRTLAACIVVWKFIWIWIRGGITDSVIKIWAKWTREKKELVRNALGLWSQPRFIEKYAPIRLNKW